MGVILKDHEGLHHAVGRAALAGGAAAVAGVFLPAWAGAALMVLALGLGVAIPQGKTSAALAVLLACAAGAAVQMGGPLGATVGALALGASLARGVEGRWRQLLAVGMGAVGAATAGLIGRAIGDSAALAFLPSGIEALAAGVAGGFVVGVSSIARHVDRLPPRAEGELEALDGQGELGQLLLRAAGAY